MRRGQNKTLSFPVWVAVVLVSALPASGRENPPLPDPPLSVEFPTAAVEVLANGLELLLVERHSIPLVTVALAVRAGAVDDPEGLGGTAQMVTLLMDQGTESRPAREIAERIDRMGASIQKEAEWDDSLLGFTVLSDQIEQASELLADLVMNPAFRPEEVDLLRQQTLSALRIASRDPSYLADSVFNRAVFRASPYGHPLDGTRASVPRITEEDLRSFHQRHYRPSNAILVLVGDFQPARGRRLAEKYFGSWKGKGKGEKEEGGSGESMEMGSEQAPASGRRIIVVDLPGAVQTEIRVGNLAPHRASADYAALEMSNEILGGTAPDRLFEALRTREGLVYGVAGRLDARRTSGAWRIETATRTAGTLKTLRIILAEMKRMATRRVSRSEIELARSYLKGNMLLQFESAESVSGKLLELLVHDLSPDYWNTFHAGLDPLGRDELLEATRRWLGPERSLIVLVGNAKAFREGLDVFGSVEVVSAESLNLESPTLGSESRRVEEQ